jgi:hypothetical protein
MNLFENKIFDFIIPGFFIDPGSYQIVISVNNSQGWTLANVLEGVPITILNVLPNEILPDPYEFNDETTTATKLPLSFNNDVAKVNIINANIDISADLDHYVFDLENNYEYTVYARVQDVASSDNGGAYTCDVRWSYYSQVDGWQGSYDDVALTPDKKFKFPSGQLLFVVSPFFPGNLGTYDFDIEITRELLTKTEDILINGSAIIAPNPSDKYTEIVLKDDQLKPKDISVFTQTGQLVYKTELLANTSKIIIPTEGFTNGLYLIHMATDKGVWNSKLTVQH